MKLMTTTTALLFLASCAASSAWALTTPEHAAKAADPKTAAAVKPAQPAPGGTASKGDEVRVKEAAKPGTAEAAKQKK